MQGAHGMGAGADLDGRVCCVEVHNAALPGRVGPWDPQRLSQPQVRDWL